MSNCATFPHLTHPWFACGPTNMKRKASPQPSQEEQSTSAVKRRRTEVLLARDFAVMNLQPTPPTMEVEDVKMRTSSWYEPEPNRIIVTTLDTSSDEEEEEEKETRVLPQALINPFRTSQQVPIAPPQQALVLYKPLPIPTIEKEEKVVDEDAMDVEP